MSRPEELERGERQERLNPPEVKNKLRPVNNAIELALAPYFDQDLGSRFVESDSGDMVMEAVTPRHLIYELTNAVCRADSPSQIKARLRELLDIVDQEQMADGRYFNGVYLEEFRVDFSPVQSSSLDFKLYERSINEIVYNHESDPRVEVLKSLFERLTNLDLRYRPDDNPDTNAKKIYLNYIYKFFCPILLSLDQVIHGNGDIHNSLDPTNKDQKSIVDEFIQARELFEDLQKIIKTQVDGFQIKSGLSEKLHDINQVLAQNDLNKQDLDYDSLLSRTTFITSLVKLIRLKQFIAQEVLTIAQSFNQSLILYSQESTNRNRAQLKLCGYYINCLERLLHKLNVIISL